MYFNVYTFSLIVIVIYTFTLIVKKVELTEKNIYSV